MGAFPPGQSPQPPNSSMASQAVELPSAGAGPSHGGPSISFGAPSEGQMSIAASESGLESYGDEDLPGP